MIVNVRSLNNCIASPGSSMLAETVLHPFRVPLETLAPREPVDPVDLP